MKTANAHQTALKAKVASCAHYVPFNFTNKPNYVFHDDFERLLLLHIHNLDGCSILPRIDHPRALPQAGSAGEQNQESPMHGASIKTVSGCYARIHFFFFAQLNHKSRLSFAMYQGVLL